MDNKSYYYNIDDDIAAYPDAWAYIVIGGRNTGKTYGGLKSCTLNRRKHAFIKRTIEDVEMLTAGSGSVGQKVKTYSIDLSPYKSINRDLHTNIRAFKIDKGIGGFFETSEEGEAVGEPKGYLLALSAVQKFKGFDMSDADWLIFDEFIPQPWERINRKEGEQVMDLYKTIARDREHRALPPLKLVAFANATQASNPLCNILEITDIIVNMQLLDEEFHYIKDRGILIHMLKPSLDFIDQELQSGIAQAMKDTAWGQMAFFNEFAYNDFTNIGRKSLKGYQGYVRLKYKRDYYYIYRKEGDYYVSKSKCNHYIFDYDLNKENDQKAFYYNQAIDLRSACIEGRVQFQSFTMYDIIINFKKYFVI